jgi:integrase
MAKTKLRLVAPGSELRTVALRRRSNRDMGRDREHLTELEVDRLIKAAKGHRHGHRDATMILIGFRHGLRVSELCDLQWSSIEFETGTMHVRRAKGGQEVTHPLLGDELRALRELKRQSASPFVFASERRGPFTPSALSYSRVSARKPRSALRYIRTCFGMPAATRWRTRGWIRGLCKPIWVIDRSIRRRAMPLLPLAGSKTSGGGRRARFSSVIFPLWLIVKAHPGVLVIVAQDP